MTMKKMQMRAKRRSRRHRCGGGGGGGGCGQARCPIRGFAGRPTPPGAKATVTAPSNAMERWERVAEAAKKKKRTRKKMSPIVARRRRRRRRRRQRKGERMRSKMARTRRRGRKKGRRRWWLQGVAALSMATAKMDPAPPHAETAQTDEEAAPGRHRRAPFSGLFFSSFFPFFFVFFLCSVDADRVG
ncbi:hypothetical protein DFJ73DRAFT_407428 [Zopfochytrium polystomum]|nr:hypothetical protein DFJ73DRAFT_407428 [Zopfochytrium polystomum]